MIFAAIAATVVSFASQPAEVIIRIGEPPKISIIAPAPPALAAEAGHAEEPPDIFAKRPLLKEVCSCESWGKPGLEPRQFEKDGSPLWSHYGTSDVGGCQINFPTWGEKAEELRLDIIGSRDDNVEIAAWIQDNDSRGIENWRWSRACWGQFEGLFEK